MSNILVLSSDVTSSRDAKIGRWFAHSLCKIKWLKILSWRFPEDDRGKSKLFLFPNIFVVSFNFPLFRFFFQPIVMGSNNRVQYQILKRLGKNVKQIFHCG